MDGNAGFCGNGRLVWRAARNFHAGHEGCPAADYVFNTWSPLRPQSLGGSSFSRDQTSAPAEMMSYLKRHSAQQVFMFYVSKFFSMKINYSFMKHISF